MRAYPTLLGSLTFHGGMGGCRLYFFSPSLSFSFPRRREACFFFFFLFFSPELGVTEAQSFHRGRLVGVFLFFFFFSVCITSETYVNTSRMILEIPNSEVPYIQFKAQVALTVGSGGTIRPQLGLCSSLPYVL